MTSPEIRQRRITKGQELAALVRALLSIERSRREIADCRAGPTRTADPGKIIAAVTRGHQVLDSTH